jgi:ribonuclease H / adenosylcobalamin/alpha-ribazole phosphatase
VSRRLIVEADGGARGNPGPAAWGAVVRDAQTGEILAERAEAIGTATNNVAEYKGLIAGLRAAEEIDPQATVDVRMDSRLVIEQMAGRWQIKNPGLRPLALEARSSFPYERVSWTWVPRSANAHADRLLNEVLDLGTGRINRSAPGDGIDGDSGEGSPASKGSNQGTPQAKTAKTEPRVDEAEVEPAVPSVGWAELGPPTTLLLVRHGETAFTGRKLFSGAGGSDPELSEIGRLQAQRAAAALANRGDIAAVVASPLRRARQTAGVIADRLGCDIRIVEEGFSECAFGEWDGLTFREVRERWPEELDMWLSSTSVAPPGGESFDSLTQRVVTARDKLLARFAGQAVVVATHVTPVKILVRLVLDAPPHALFRMELLPASLTEVQYYDDGISSLRSFNIAPSAGDVRWVSEVRDGT